MRLYLHLRGLSIWILMRKWSRSSGFLSMGSHPWWRKITRKELRYWHSCWRMKTNLCLISWNLSSFQPDHTATWRWRSIKMQNKILKLCRMTILLICPTSTTNLYVKELSLVVTRGMRMLWLYFLRQTRHFPIGLSQPSTKHWLWSVFQQSWFQKRWSRRRKSTFNLQWGP